LSSQVLNKNKFISFLLKKTITFLRFITKKVMYVFCFYRDSFYDFGGLTFVDFFVDTIKIFLKLIKQNYELINVFPTLRNLFKPRKDIISSYSDDPTSTGLYYKLIGLIQKKGGRLIAKNCVDKALFLVGKKLKVSKKKILLGLFNRLKTSIEPRNITVRRRLHSVPSPVNRERQTFLIVKWLLRGVLKDSKKRGFVYKLKYHILKVILHKNSLPYKTKRYLVHKAIENRSNFHYRWW